MYVLYVLYVLEKFAGKKSSTEFHATIPFFFNIETYFINQ